MYVLLNEELERFLDDDAVDVVEMGPIF